MIYTAFSTIPAAFYILIQNFVLHANTAVMGASVWFFLLLGMEAMRTYRTNPHFVIATYNIPTWTTPLMLVVVVSALVPSSSLLGHLCGLAVGYICTRNSPFPIFHSVKKKKKKKTRACFFANMGLGVCAF